MFVFPNQESGFDPSQMDLLDEKNYRKISPLNLFRVRKIASKHYNFIHHLETSVTRTRRDNDDSKNLDIEKFPALRKLCWQRIQQPNGLAGIIKVRINHLGQIVDTGEY